MARDRKALRAKHGFARRARGALLSAAVLGLAARAQAAGVEDAPAGSIALGRAANYVNVRDFMATWQNPANLAVIDKRDVGGELRLPIMNACFDRARNPDKEYKAVESFNKVCNETKVFPTGNLGYAMSFDNGLGFGVGLFTPSGVAKLKFGDDTIVTQNPRPNEQYPITTSGTESANRALLLERNVLAAFLMAGVGYQIMPELRVGVSLGAGFADVNFKNVSSVQGSTFLDPEVLAQVHVKDWFVPRATFSVVGSPIDSLDIMAQVTVNGDINASGHLDAQANGIQGAPRGDCKSTMPGPHCRVNDITLKVPYQRVEVYLGGRYGIVRRGHTHGTKFDPMRDEVGDVELDAYFVNTANVNNYRLTLYDAGNPNDLAKINFSSDPTGAAVALPANANIPHNWRNVYGFRVGGDYNVIPALLSLRAGFSYESSAVRSPYMNLDYFVQQKVGLHLGASVMVGSMVKLTLAYAHLFYGKVNAPVAGGKVPEIAAIPAQPPNDVPAQPVNEGTFRARQDIVSLQGNVKF
ncbi:MAG: hypothetical protein QM778_12840 [Myxococcales bacterium]